MPTLEIDYHDTRLRVETDATPSARLYINNIQRMQESSEGLPCTLRLSSTVQTDYEWHEFIETTVTFDESGTHVVLMANNKEIASETYKD